MKNIQTDTVIIGSGASGISAAMQLIQLGKHVIVLEKGDQIGGAGKFGAIGLFAVESQQQKAQGITYTCSEALTDMQEFNHYLINAPLLSRVLHLSADTIDWMDDLGLHTQLVPNTQLPHLSSPAVYHQFKPINLRNHAWDVLADKIRANGDQILTGTAATSLNYPNGRLHGVNVVTKTGEEFEIQCQNVIVADGGYTGSHELMAAQFDDTDELVNLGERKATGDGIKMVEAIGGDSKHTPILFAHACATNSKINPLHRENAVQALSELPFLWVDPNGNRFANEEVIYDHAYWSNAAHAVGGSFFELFDESAFDYLEHQTLDWELSMERAFTEAGTTPITTTGPLPNLRRDFDAVIADGDAFKADTLAELADQLHLPLVNLKQTIEHYNAAVTTQHDSYFGTNPKYLKFSYNGPFYALKQHAATLGTQNGINVNENLEALRKDRTPIKGVYVTGNNANGLYSDSYPIFEGLANSFAWNSGRIAAMEIAKKEQ